MYLARVTKAGFAIERLDSRGNELTRATRIHLRALEWLIEARSPERFESQRVGDDLREGEMNSPR